MHANTLCPARRWPQGAPTPLEALNAIKDLRVIETIKEGPTTYRRESEH